MRHFESSRNLLALVTVVLALACTLATSEAASQRNYNYNRIDRRGFKSSLLSTARGFGKRSSLPALPASAATEDANEARMYNHELAEEIVRSPQLLRAIFHILDRDEDGVVTPEEIVDAMYKERNGY